MACPRPAAGVSLRSRSRSELRAPLTHTRKLRNEFVLFQRFRAFGLPEVARAISRAGESGCHVHSKSRFRIRGQVAWHGNCSSLVQLGCVRAPDQRNSEVGQATLAPVETGWRQLRQAFPRELRRSIGWYHGLHGGLPVWRDRLICRCMVAPQGEGTNGGSPQSVSASSWAMPCRAGRSPAVGVPGTCRAGSCWAHAALMD